MLETNNSNGTSNSNVEPKCQISQENDITLKAEVDTPADFETAITATGFGKFNIVLLILTLPAAWAVQFESALGSYIFPAAECDLKLTLNDKGLINAAVFIGMISGGPLWGFLLDTLGRRKMLFIGSLLEFIVFLATSFTQTAVYMVILKFLGGTLAGGLYVAYVTYLQEFHSSKYRGRIQMIVGLIYNTPNLLMPILASFFLPLNFHVTLVNFIEFRAWNLLILVCSIGSLTSTISFYFLPESPKYLMSAGENEKALVIFQKAYITNFGKDKEPYGITMLTEETKNQNKNECKKSFVEYLKTGWKQISPLFMKEHITKLLLVCSIEPLVQMSLNTFRLWLPQIFQSIHDYQVQNNGTTSDLCTMLQIFHPDHNANETVCNVNLENNFAVYFNSMVIAMVTICGYVMAGTLINIFGRKLLSVAVGIGSSCTVIALYFSQNSVTTLTLASLNIAFTNICFDVVLSIIVAMFPTTLRGTAVSLTMLIGRLLTVVGNLVFPKLLETSCAGPFFTLGVLMLVSVLVSLLLPKIDNIHLK